MKMHFSIFESSIYAKIKLEEFWAISLAEAVTKFDFFFFYSVIQKLKTSNISDKIIERDFFKKSGYANPSGSKCYYCYYYLKIANPPLPLQSRNINKHFWLIKK